MAALFNDDMPTSKGSRKRGHGRGGEGSREGGWGGHLLAWLAQLLPTSSMLLQGSYEAQQSKLVRSLAGQGQTLVQ